MGRRRFFQFPELLLRATQVLGGDPLAVREVFGATRHGDQSVSASFLKSGAIGDGEAAPALTKGTLAAPYVERAAVFEWLGRHSAARLFLEFQGGDGAPKAQAFAGTATIVPWRIQLDGRIVRGTPITGVGHRVEVRDPDVAGRVTLYQVTTVADEGDSTALRVYVAGEGAGYEQPEP